MREPASAAPVIGGTALSTSQAPALDATAPLDDSLASRRVLFVSVSYWPEHAGIGPYAAASAEHLAERGAHVVALTGMPHYPSWQVHPDDRWRLRRVEERGGVRVVRLRQFVPARQSTLTRAVYEGSYLGHALLRGLRAYRPDVVVGCLPALSSAVLATRIARRFGVPLSLVVQDFVGAGAEQSGIRGGRGVAGLIGSLEARVLRAADTVGVVHESFLHRARLLGVPDERLRLVPNWTHVDEPVADRAELRTRQGWDGDFTVVHAGNMGLKQGLDVVVEAARIADRRNLPLRFVLVGDGNQRARLAALARGVRRLEIRPPVDERDFPDLLGAADALLVTQRASVHDMSLPSKLTSYFAAGRPVLASVSDGGGTAAEVRRSGGGLHCAPEDPEALVNAALTLRADPNRAEELGARGRSYCHATLSAEAGLARLRGLVTDALEHRRQPA